MERMEIVNMRKVIPATPGWNVAAPEMGDGGKVDGICLMPIVAWAVSIDWEESDYRWGVAFPVCVESLTGYDRYCICTPGGKFIFPESHSVETADELIKEFQELEDTKAAARAKKAGEYINRPEKP